MNKLLSLKKLRKLQSKSPSMDVPSDQKTNNGELSHFCHPEHNLIPFNAPYVFMCMVCKETGAGKRFICQTCSFDMHEFCALAPHSFHGHPFHLQHQLDFSPKIGKMNTDEEYAYSIPEQCEINTSSDVCSIN
jgi:C1 domain